MFARLGLSFLLEAVEFSESSTRPIFPSAQREKN
jgi:hypothetical protein